MILIINYQKMNKIYAYSIIILLSLTSCNQKEESIWKTPINKNNSTTITEWIKNSEIISYWSVDDQFKNLDENLKNITSSWNINILEDSIKKNDFIVTQKTIKDIMTDYNKKKNNLSSNEKESIKSLLYLNVSNILNEWNYGFNEKTKSNEWKKFIETEILQDPDFIDPFYSNYFLWYSQEIIKNYTWALSYYDISLDYAGNTEKNKMLKSIILNQIWHLYDLKWELEKAYWYYYESYKNNNRNAESVINIWRYFVRKNNIKEAIIYFNYWLQLTQSPKLQSEILYNLSTLYLYHTEEKNNLTLSYNYWVESTKLNPNSPLGYLWQARVLIVKWEKIEEAESLLKKSISLYPEFSSWYERLWLIEQWKWKYSTSIDYFLKSIETIKNDIILMDNERVTNSSRVNYFLATSLALWKNQEMCIKHLHEMLDWKDTIALLMFINEVKKENYWNFKNMIWNKDFETLAKTILNI